MWLWVKKKKVSSYKNHQIIMSFLPPFWFIHPSGPHHFREGSFLIATLSKPRLQGAELRLQQHFRWVTLRWDQEPLHGLLGRHLRRKLLHKVTHQGLGHFAAVCTVLQDIRDNRMLKNLYIIWEKRDGLINLNCSPTVFIVLKQKHNKGWGRLIFTPDT